MSKHYNALRADFAEVKKSAKKVAQIRCEKKAMKYGLRYEDYEEEDEYTDLRGLFEELNSDSTNKEGK